MCCGGRTRRGASLQARQPPPRSLPLKGAGGLGVFLNDGAFIRIQPVPPPRFVRICNPHAWHIGICNPAKTSQAKKRQASSPFGASLPPFIFSKFSIYSRLYFPLLWSGQRRPFFSSSFILYFFIYKQLPAREGVSFLAHGHARYYI